MPVVKMMPMEDEMMCSLQAFALLIEPSTTQTRTVASKQMWITELITEFCTPYQIFRTICGEKQQQRSSGTLLS